MIKNKNMIRYIFTFFAFFGLFSSIYIYKQFQKTSQDIEELNMQSNISYVCDVSNNITNLINEETPNDIYDDLKKDPKLIREIAEFLELFVTNKYRYVYVVRKIPNSQKFEFLLDGTKNKDDKSELSEPFEPNSKQSWIDVYKTKEDIYFQDKSIESLWFTYLKPIIQNGEVKAILAIDFSITEQHFIQTSLSKLSQILLLLIIFTSIFFMVIFIVSYVDKKRILLLEQQSKEIQNFNDTLKNKIDQELDKNRQKDKMLQQQSKLAQMGEMISMIAHQWRQPLAAIGATSASMTIKATIGKLDKETALELSNKISSHTQHLSKTIDDFRDFYKTSKEKKETTFMIIIEDVLNIVEVSVANKNIKLLKELEYDEKITTYPNEIKQVVLNLIKNAEDILMENDIKEPYIKIKTYTQNNNAILEVSDNAEGVPEDIIDKIFEPYFSTKLEKNGTGLGLYMSKTIIEEHCGGKLSVSNNEFGAVFEIKLPLKSEVEK